MKNPNYKSIELLPLSVIKAARAGDAEAVERVFMYPDALRRIWPASCVRGRVHEAPSGNQAHFFHRHDTVTNRPPEVETA